MKMFCTWETRSYCRDSQDTYWNSVTKQKTAGAKLTFLVDNQAGEGLVGEHGFSVWIESQGRHILFDTGQGPALKANADALGVDLALTEMLVLSHGHYDHTGGISTVIQAAGEVDVYCHPAFRIKRYALKAGKAEAIHIPQTSAGALAELPAGRLHRVMESCMLTDAIGITGPIPRLTDFEDTGGPFYLDPEGTSPDPIEDDQALWIQTEEGVVILAGCCHAGLVNTVNFVRLLSNGMRVRAVLGGFHLMNAGLERLGRTIDSLARLEAELILPCHCTGEPATNAIESALPGIVRRGASGSKFEF
jgi:7,8-dihydropterin-6-yl-methyl-4-(beta-D-ribofuranosyl)aminobenzene 5'-phosphate synthase